VMYVQGSDQAWRSWRTTWVPPLGNHKSIANRANDISCKRRSNDWRIHIQSESHSSIAWIEGTSEAT
jgi:hypothetical protein